MYTLKIEVTHPVWSLMIKRAGSRSRATSSYTHFMSTPYHALRIHGRVNMALHTKALSAASKGDLETLRSLKARLNLSECCDKFGASPVHYAARAGKVDCLRWLIQTAGVSGNKSANNGATPAHDAAATGQLDCLQWLIQNGGCSANGRDACGATPLHLG